MPCLVCNDISVYLILSNIVAAQWRPVVTFYLFTLYHAPPLLGPSVEVSRAKRIERQQSRFRDRGGIFVPSEHNALLEMFLLVQDSLDLRKLPKRSRLKVLRREEHNRKTEDDGIPRSTTNIKATKPHSDAEHTRESDPKGKKLASNRVRSTENSDHEGCTDKGAMSKRVRTKQDEYDEETSENIKKPRKKEVRASQNERLDTCAGESSITRKCTTRVKKANTKKAQAAPKAQSRNTETQPKGKKKQQQIITALSPIPESLPDTLPKRKATSRSHADISKKTIMPDDEDSDDVPLMTRLPKVPTTAKTNQRKSETLRLDRTSDLSCPEVAEQKISAKTIATLPVSEDDNRTTSKTKGAAKSSSTDAMPHAQVIIPLLSEHNLVSSVEMSSGTAKAANTKSRKRHVKDLVSETIPKDILAGKECPDDRPLKRIKGQPEAGTVQSRSSYSVGTLIQHSESATSKPEVAQKKTQRKLPASYAKRTSGRLKPKPKPRLSLFPSPSFTPDSDADPIDFLS
ncbi:hypothetical protein A0H81_05429 [Grifola frondosa]|uniref:Uncharacterized protein n=1 Tax=Grifola frondosa TaxID=5627 RepID=A0A1C7MDW2_GRIFR|nr:hypothetical protein A0H81_05429 [Grifola frondosa]